MAPKIDFGTFGDYEKESTLLRVVKNAEEDNNRELHEKETNVVQPVPDLKGMLAAINFDNLT